MPYVRGRPRSPLSLERARGSPANAAASAHACVQWSVLTTPVTLSLSLSLSLCSRHLTAAHPIGSSRLRVMARAAPVHPHRWRLLLLLAAVICTTPHASANSTVSWIQKRADMRHAMWGSRVLTNRSHPDQVPSLSLPPSLSLSLSLSPPPPPAPCLPPSLPPFLPASLLSLSAFTNYCSPS